MLHTTAVWAGSSEVPVIWSNPFFQNKKFLIVYTIGNNSGLSYRPCLLALFKSASIHVDVELITLVGRRMPNIEKFIAFWFEKKAVKI